MKSFNAQLGEVLNDNRSRYFAKVQIVISLATVLSITGIILETVQSLGKYHALFLAVEWTMTILFSIEYLARLISSNRKLKYVFSFWGVVDLLSILPTLLSLGNLTFLKSVRVLRILRLMRILRLAKISRAYLQTHNRAQGQNEVNRINISIYFLALFSAIIALGSMLYVAEHGLAAYSSIPLAMLQAAKIILGGLGQAPVVSVVGEIIVLMGRLVGLALFGLLISVIGTSLNQLIFGKE